MPTPGNYMPASASNTMPGSRQRQAYGSNAVTGGVVALAGAGVPTNNVTGLGTATVGSTYTDTTNGKMYIVTATDLTTTVTYVSVGSQT